MARIQTYDQDSNVTFQDKLIGTDSASFATKNFTIQSLMDLINQLSGVDLFDGIVFKYQAFEPAATDPSGALNLVGGAAATQAFSATTQIIVSKKVVNGIDVENYVSSFVGKKIKVSKQGDFDKFGIFRVTNVQNHSNTRYLVLTVTHKESNGNFEPNSYYFLSFYGLPLVTDLEDVTNAGSGLVITDAERTTLGTALQPSDITDNLTSTDANKALSANQGKILKDLTDDLFTLLDVDAADKPALDTLREVVNFCQINAATLSSLGIGSIAGLQAALNTKVDVVTGKALSENDFTNALLTKLNGIAAGAQVNVKPDFNATTGAADEILNIPSDITDLSAHNVTELSDVNTSFFTGSTATTLTDAGSGSIITTAERTKLGAIDVNPTNSTITDGTDSITVATTSRTIEVAGTANEVEVSPTGAQDLSTNRTFTVGLPNDVTIANDLTVTGDVAASSFVKSGGTSTQILLANGSVIDLTIESQGINSNDSDTKVPSNAAVKDAIDTAISNLVSGAPTALDTLNELAAALGDDAAFSTTITTALGNRLKFDSSQTLSSAEKTQVLTNLGITSTIQEINFLDGVTSTLAYRTHTVTVGSKTGGGNAFYVDGGELPVLITLPGAKYRFDLSDATNANHDFQFSENIDGVGTGSYTANVTAVGTPGQSGSYIEITGSYQYPTLYYYSPNSTGMGNKIKTDASHLEGLTSDKIEFDHDLIVDSKIVTKHSNTVKTMVVTVVTKTAAHPAHGVAGASSLGYSIDGIESPELTFAVGNTYKFDQSDSSNANHPLRFYTDEAKTAIFGSGVTTSGIPGQSGAYTQIIPLETTPNVLYYQCSAHVKMGWKAVFNTRNLTNFLTDDLNEGSSNLYYTDARFDTRLATKDTGNLSEGTNLYYTDARVLSKINSTSIDALSDVDTTTSAPSSGQALVWNGSNFVPNTVGSTLTVQEEGNALSSAATVLNFVGSGVTASGSGGTKTITIGGSIDDLSDVDITTNAPSSGQILKWDGSKFVPGTDNSGSAASDSFATISVSGQTNVVADSSSDTLTLAAGDNMTITTDASTDTITLASTGGTGQIIKQSFNGTGSQALFTLSNTISDIDNISVYVSGVLQYPSNYTVSGTDITFVSGSIPASGTNNVHVIHTTAAPNVADVGTVFLDQFTGNGTATQFSPLSTAPTSEDLTDVYIDGIYQQKNAYTIAGTQIDFGSGNAPVNGAYIEVKTTGSIAPAAVSAAQTTLVSDAFTATSGQTSFTLVNGSPTSKELTMVFIQGVYQAKTNYSLNSGAIVFSSATTLGDTVEVISVSGANLTTSPVTSVNGQTGVVSIASDVTSVNGQTGAVTVASTMGVNVINSSTTATANNLYVLTANLTLTLPASPSAGDAIKISNRSGVATCVLARNGSNIMGSASDLTLDTASASFELIYSDATNGWVIIGQ